MAKWIGVCVTSVLVLTLVSLGHGQEPAAFFKGKTITFFVGSRAGGGNDLWGRSVAPYLKKYTGANVIVQNKAGASGAVMTNYLMTNAKPDGLSVGLYLGGVIALHQLLESKQVQYDLTKMSWLGRVAPIMNTIQVSARSYKSITDLQAAKKPIKHGAAGLSSIDTLAMALFAEALNLNLKFVPGFRGTKDVILAMLRGELDSTNRDIISFLPYIKEGTIVPLAAVNNTRDPRAPNVPTIYEAVKMPAKSKEWLGLCEVGRVIIAPPGIPAERLGFLQNALKKAMEDPDLVAQIEQRKDVVGYLPGGKAKELVIDLLQMPAKDRETFRYLLLEKYK